MTDREIEAGRARGRPSRARSAEITREILAAAAKLLLADGFDGTSMEAVANTAGIPKTTLYKRFSDKNELVRAVIEDRTRAWSQISSRRNASLPGTLRERLIHYMVTMLVWATDPEVRAIGALNAKLPEGQGHSELAIDSPGYRNMETIIAEALSELAPAEGLCVHNPKGVARMVMTFVAGAIVSRSSLEPLTSQAARDLATETVGYIMDGAASW